MKAARDDLPQRRPVWLALSWLYLDTDLDGQLPALADTLAASPYSLADLENILRRELHPVLQWNLLAAAGVWDGFDAHWLEQQILRRRRLLRLGFLFPQREWQQLAGLVRDRRNDRNLH
jgi:hypothetical protein